MFTIMIISVFLKNSFSYLLFRSDLVLRTSTFPLFFYFFMFYGSLYLQANGLLGFCDVNRCSHLLNVNNYMSWVGIWILEMIRWGITIKWLGATDLNKVWVTIIAFTIS